MLVFAALWRLLKDRADFTIEPQDSYSEEAIVEIGGELLTDL